MKTLAKLTPTGAFPLHRDERGPGGERPATTAAPGRQRPRDENAAEAQPGGERPGDRNAPEPVAMASRYRIVVVRRGAVWIRTTPSARPRGVTRNR